MFCYTFRFNTVMCPTLFHLPLNLPKPKARACVCVCECVCHDVWAMWGIKGCGRMKRQHRPSAAALLSLLCFHRRAVIKIIKAGECLCFPVKPGFRQSQNQSRKTRALCCCRAQSSRTCGSRPFRTPQHIDYQPSWICSQMTDRTFFNQSFFLNTVHA